MIVLDAGVWVRALVDVGAAGDACRRALTEDPDWAAPAHAPIEVLRTIRRYESAGLIDLKRADDHAATVWRAEVRYTGGERWILAAVWHHRHDLSPYDAPYVALARYYRAPLVTLDEHLARAAVAAGVDVLVPASLDE